MRVLPHARAPTPAAVSPSPPSAEIDTNDEMVTNIIVNTDNEVGDAALYGVGHCRYRY